MTAPALLDDRRLRRFARLAAPRLGGAAAQRPGLTAARHRAGAGVEFLDLRPYQPGDDLRHIDWRRTGRADRHARPVVRRYRDAAAADWFLCVDGSASMSHGGKWRLAAELATALAYALIHAGHRPALAVFTDTLAVWCPPGRGERQFALCVERLLAHRPSRNGGGSAPGACAERLRASGHLVLVSDFLREDAMAADLRRLAAGVAAGSVIQVLGTGETAVQGDGPLLLLDCESGAAARVDVSAASRAAAGAALAAHRERLRALCDTLGWRCSACVDEDDWERVLLAHLGVAA